MPHAGQCLLRRKVSARQVLVSLARWEGLPVLLLEVAVGVGGVPGVVKVDNDPGGQCAIDGLKVLLQPLVLRAVILVVRPPAVDGQHEEPDSGTQTGAAFCRTAWMRM